MIRKEVSNTKQPIPCNTFRTQQERKKNLKTKYDTFTN